MDPAHEINEAPTTVPWSCLGYFSHTVACAKSPVIMQMCTVCVYHTMCKYWCLPEKFRWHIYAGRREDGFQQKIYFLLSSGYVFPRGGKEMSLGITKSFKHWGSSFFISVPKP